MAVCEADEMWSQGCDLARLNLQRSSHGYTLLADAQSCFFLRCLYIKVLIFFPLSSQVNCTPLQTFQVVVMTD